MIVLGIVVMLVSMINLALLIYYSWIEDSVRSFEHTLAFMLTIILLLLYALLSIRGGS